MKPKAPLRLWLIVAFGIFLAVAAPAATFYVDVNSTNPTPPYSDWGTAATNIQDAIDASSNGDSVLVTNGVYQFGGHLAYGTTTNRIVLNKAIRVMLYLIGAKV